ncbi:MAG: hypothetical protein EKK29_05935 [Hyphomicrobiales bacterium]|nr:MAG: hypothetical protein EKK29_05935 [Hyphomicrobiales bacterium]
MTDSFIEFFETGSLLADPSTKDGDLPGLVERHRMARRALSLKGADSLSELNNLLVAAYLALGDDYPSSERRDDGNAAKLAHFAIENAGRFFDKADGKPDSMDGWQLIGSAPKDGSVFSAVYENDKGERAVFAVRWAKDGGGWIHLRERALSGQKGWGQPICWQPLPKPPEKRPAAPVRCPSRAA